MRINKRGMAYGAALLCAGAAVAAGVTWAYLSAQTETAVNTFQVIGNIELSMTERFEDALGNDLTGGGAFGGTATEVDGGSAFIKEPFITVGEGSEECWVRLKVEITPALYAYLDGPMEADSAHWEMSEIGSRDGFQLVYYTHKAPVGVGDMGAPLASPFSQVVFSDRVTHEADFGDGQIRLTAQAVQRLPDSNYSDAFADVSFD